MGKGSRRQKKSTRNPKHLGSANFFSPEKDLDDEVDAFHKQRDVIPLDINADAGYDLDEDIEHPVFEIEGADENDSSDSDNEEEGGDDGNGDNDDDVEDDGDIGDETRYTGFAAKIARQAKFLRQKMGGVEDDMHDDAEHEEERKVKEWGRRKGTYYSADNIDFELQSSDEDLPQEEEEEVLRLQMEKAKYLLEEDFGLKDGDEDEGDSSGEQEKTLQDMLVGEKYITKSYVDGLPEDMDYEEVKKDLSALSKEEQMDVVYSSAPELVGLLSELNEALKQLEKVKPLLCKVKDEPHITKGGVHYLEVKQLLLLAYCQAIVFYLLLKSEGHPVRDHPVIARLVEINKLLEKVKQIDANLPLHIEEIANHVGIVPNKEVVKESAALDVSANVTNVSAKTRNVTPAHEMSELVKLGLSEDHDHKLANKKDQNGQVGLQSLEMLKVRARLEEKLKQRGMYNTMPPRPDRTQKHTLQPLNKRMETFTDFDDEVTEFTKHRGMSHDHTSSSHSMKLSQLVAAKVNKPKLISGDEDLPKRDDIGERRRKYELRVLARANVGDEDEGLGTMSMDVDLQGDGPLLESEDELYKEVKKQRAVKLSTKEELYSRTTAVSTLPDRETDGKRHITYQMEKNKGLTRSRKKLTKIPRKKYKLKHQKAVVRRKGQVRDIRKPTGPYGGEASGINVRVSRSVRFKS